MTLRSADEFFFRYHQHHQLHALKAEEHNIRSKRLIIFVVLTETLQVTPTDGGSIRELTSLQDHELTSPQDHDLTSP